MDTSEIAAKEIESVGLEIDQVKCQIDHEIIEHFLRHLSSSPNKAIEELVTNSFDAFAQKAYGDLPGKYTAATVLVWDNGSSGIRRTSNI